MWPLGKPCHPSFSQNPGPGAFQREGKPNTSLRFPDNEVKTRSCIEVSTIPGNAGGHCYFLLGCEKLFLSWLYLEFHGGSLPVRGGQAQVCTRSSVHIQWLVVVV